MRIKFVFFLPFTLAVWGVLAGMRQNAGAAEPKSQRTQEGLHFTVPEEWPIEKRGGVLSPMPVEEYVIKRFQEIESRITAISQDLSNAITEVKNSCENSRQNTSTELKRIDDQINGLKGDIRDLNSALSQPRYASPAESSVGKQVETISQETSRKLTEFNARLDSFEEERLRSFQFNLDVLEDKLKILSEEIEGLR